MLDFTRAPAVEVSCAHCHQLQTINLNRITYYADLSCLTVHVGRCACGKGLESWQAFGDGEASAYLACMLELSRAHQVGPQLAS